MEVMVGPRHTDFSNTHQRDSLSQALLRGNAREGDRQAQSVDV